MKKLIFISAYPTKDNEKDGMIQRIKAIDELFKDANRIYLWLDRRQYFIPKFFRPTPNCIVIQANLFLYFPAAWLYILLTPALLYCHSVIEATKVIFPILIGKTLILDIHGVVPEEMQLSGKIRYSKILALTEKIALRRALFSIIVTNKMRRHFAEKYGSTKFDMELLPIFSRNLINHEKDTNPIKPTVIYAGGTQPWQNLPEMFDLAKNNTEVNFIFLFSNLEEVQKKHNAILKGLTNIELFSVPHQQVHEWYAKANFGLILRDDIVVNRVACPTKLIEYIEYGLIPVIGNCNIGDFVEDGLFFLRVEDFNIASAIEKIRTSNIFLNKKIVTKMESMKKEGSTNILKRTLIFLNK